MSTNAGVSGFERLVFLASRFIALLIAVLTVIGIASCLVFMMNNFSSNTDVSFNEVEQAISSSHQTNNASQSVSTDEVASSIKLPPPIKKYLSGNNRQILDSWLNQLDSQSQREKFVSELSNVISKAEENKTDVTDAINTYKTLKFKKLSDASAQQYVTMATKAAVAGTLIALIFLLIIVALVLVLLAIERHTRETAKFITEQKS